MVSPHHARFMSKNFHTCGYNLGKKMPLLGIRKGVDVQKLSHPQFARMSKNFHTHSLQIGLTGCEKKYHSRLFAD